LSLKKLSEDTIFVFTKKKKITQLHMLEGGWDNAVCTATSYGLDGAGIESHWTGRFSALIQTSPRPHQHLVQ
jgi:hypothetical protein